MASVRPATGALYMGNSVARQGVDAFRDALAALARPVFVVDLNGRPGVTDSGRAVLGSAPADGAALPLIAHAPALLPESLGSRTFREDYGVRYAVVSGEMANGIASEEMVEAMARAGLLGFFGAAGLSPTRVEAALVRFATNLAGRPYGCNLIHSPDDPALEAAVVALYLKHGMRLASASAYLDLTLPIVRYRVAGIRQDADGRIVTPNKVMAKVSRVEVARKFLSPPPEAFLAILVAEKAITEEQARLAARIPMADDITAEADSGGHTDNRPLVLLLPAIQALRGEIVAREKYAIAPRVGAAGGIATPASVAAAFAMGAAYVMTGSVNQCTREAGTSDIVRQMLAQAQTTDVAMAPAADMFEMGVKVQVLSRGTMFAVRAAKLYEWYRQYESLDALPPAVKTELEAKYLRCPIGEAWESTRSFFAARDPRQNERAAQDPKHKMALVFRSYLGQSSRWANSGVADRRLDFQIWCGPAMGAFNAWAAGSCLERWEDRRVVAITENLVAGAAVLTRLSALRTQGVELPQELEHFAPRDERALAAMRVPPAPLTLSEGRDTTLTLSEGAAVGARVEGLSATPTSNIQVVRSADEPVAIVGMGSLFPKAENLAAFWRLLRTGVDAVGDVPASHWSIADYYDPDPKAPDKTYTQRGAFLSPHSFDPTEFGIPPSILEATDTAQLLALAVARMAMDDAGYGDGISWDRGRASVLLGVTGTQELVISLGARLGHPHWRRALKDAGVDESVANDVVERISRSYVGWQENSFPGLLGNVVAGRVANRLDFGGTNCVTDAACASSLAAVHLAMMELRANRSDLVLTGGVDALNDIFMHMCFSKTPALSPTGDVRPFSDMADGTLLGEGLGMLVLKRLSDAERAGDRIHAVIKSIGTSSDGRAKSIYAPLSAGQARALREAYELADAPPSTIDLLEAHGTGTKAGDVAEFEALREVYRSSKSDGQWVALGSVKSQIGHTKAAAGAAGLIKAALALEHKVLPPTLKVDAPHASLKIAESPFYISGVARPWPSKAAHPRRAAVSSFGFGGSNFHAVLEEYRPLRAAPAWDGAVEIVALSAADKPGLLAAVDVLAKVDAATLADHAAATRASFRASDAHRLVLVVPFGADLAALCASARAQVSAGTASGKGIHYGHGAVAGSLAFLFPGQGAQYVGMGRELACVFPEMLDALEANPGISDAIHPPPSFDAAEKSRRDAALTRTDIAQPAIGAVSAGLAGVLARFGVKPALAAGHSYGELVALHATGWFDTKALATISALRGKLMAGNPGEDRGTMLAVLAPLAEIERMVAEEKLDLVLANRNAPSQGVLSGSREEIARAEAACKRRNLRSSALSVAAAFHSRFVSGAAQAFRAGLDEIAFTPSAVPVIADATADRYPSTAAGARDLLARQLAEPVRFVDVVERLYASGARTFVEVGPKSVLTGLAKSILGEREAACIAVDGSARDGMLDLAGALARLAAAGHAVRLDEWQRVPAAPRAAQRTARTPKMAVPLTGANYRAPVAPLPPSPVRAPAPVAAVPRPVAVAKNDSPGILMTKTPAAAPSNDVALEILRSNQESIRALQQLQEQTARIHQAFLEGQMQAQQSFHALITGTQQIVAAPRVMVEAAAQVVPVVPMVAAPVVAAPAVPVRAPAEAVVSTPTPPAPLPGGGGRVVATAPLPGGGGRSAAQDDVTPALLAVVSEATGYPREMLELDMDMEADLGIDSIKRVEILSLLSKKVPGAPSVNPEHLGKLRTLRQVAAFMRPEGAPVAAAAPAPAVAPAPVAASPAVSNGDAHAALVAVVAELTGYPKEMLALDMEMEADLGIDSIKRVEILSLLSKRMPGAPSVNPEKLGSLRTLRQVLDFIAPAVAGPVVVSVPATPVAVAAPVTEEVRPRRRAVIPVQLAATTETIALPAGEILVLEDGTAFAAAIVRELTTRGIPSRAVAQPFTPPSGAIAGLVLLAGSSRADDNGIPGDERRLKAAFTAAQAFGPALRKTNGARLISVSRLDGAFGHVLGAPSGVELQLGLAGLVKTASHEWPEVRARALDVSSLFADAEAAAAIAGELTAPGPIEVGVGPAGRIGLALRETVISFAPQRVSAGDVIVVTGGARGVTAECAVALAAARPVSLLLLGRTPAPTAEPAWLQDAPDEAAIKRVLLENGFSGARPSPRELGDACRAVLAAREIRGTLERLSAIGAKALYRAVDVRDTTALAGVLDEARKALGPLKGLVHGAGVLRDRRIEDKSAEDLDQVFDTKVAGLRSLLAATTGDDLRFIALFASISGRLGRRGQSDYAMANQALVGIAQVEAARRPDCRVAALDWGPWDGGMVTPALKREFEREKVELVPLAAGAQILVEEVHSSPGGPIEVVVGNGFGLPTLADDGWTLASAQRLDAETHVYLRDHVLAGKPVLPMAMIVEWFAQGARRAVPGSVLHAIEDVKLLKGVVVAGSHEDVAVWTGPVDSASGRVALELRSRSGFVHARATAVLGTSATVAPAATVSAGELKPYPHDLAKVYAEKLFHGKRLETVRSIGGFSDRGIDVRLGSAPAPSEWIRGAKGEWVADPLVLDGVFQTLILWCRETQGAPSLPSRLGALRLYRDRFPKDGVRAVVGVQAVDGSTVVSHVELIDAQGAVVARLEDYVCTVSASLDKAFTAEAGAAGARNGSGATPRA